MPPFFIRCITKSRALSRALAETCPRARHRLCGTIRKTYLTPWEGGMKASHAKRVMPWLLGAVLLTRCSCDFFGTTGALLISENDEMKLGADFDTHLRTNDSAKKEYPIFVPKTAEDIAFQNYVVDLAREILSDVPKGDKPS